MNGYGAAVSEGGKKMIRRRPPEERYKNSIGKQQKALDEFAEHETRWAEDLLLWHRLQKKEIPDVEYRAAAFFLNKEFIDKPGSLTMLYILHNRLLDGLPSPTRELAFDLLAFRFRKYGQALIEGGY